jgi:hypothetical protein
MMRSLTLLASAEPAVKTPNVPSVKTAMSV